ncbi:MAG: hypothetical protein K0R89_1150 [Ramlibacter sp.]|jgi:hypothetical protein|nr:hypothetical protein [Ramlibacter sp.]
MNENEHKDPGEAAGDGRAKHGYRNEVSWEGGKGQQPYANQGSEEQDTSAAPEAEAGNRGDASGRNLDQLEEVKGKPERPVRESPRDAG